MPEGTIGWMYYRGWALADPSGRVDDPVTACQNSAHNHMGTPLVAMRPAVDSAGNPANRPTYDCKYSHFIASAGVAWRAQTSLFCTPGYTAQWPGVCVKQVEVPWPASCSADEPGRVLGNPVLLSSGAKVQGETDYSAGPGAALQVRRTYRTLRQNGLGQSAGQGWSFWFDRHR